MHITDLQDPGTREEWRRHLGELLHGRRVICAVAPLAGYVDWVAMLEQVGARRPLLVASAVGAGPVPRPEQAEVVFLDVPDSTSMTEELRRLDGILRSLPGGVVRAVEAYDPDGTAVWLAGPFVASAPLLGRQVLSGRPGQWLALEDKMVADELWDSVGVPRAESCPAPVDVDRLREASARLDRGAGVVWAGDAREGFNGGGDYVRWVAGETELLAAFEFFSRHCSRVRVMPFLEGVPCSIHGLVLPDGTAALRPVELAILRGRAHGRRRFVYGGLGTTWVPPEEDRAQMRELARRTGERLRELVDYRGAFGIDGILTADGFRPTELNSRMSAGAVALGRAVDPCLLDLLQHNLLAGRHPGVTVDDFESWVVPAMDAARFARPVAVSPRRVAREPWDAHVTWDGTSLVRSSEPTGWSVSAGPSAVGTFCRLVTPQQATPPVRVAELNVALMRFVDEELDTGFGEVAAAPDVRPRRAMSPAAAAGLHP